MPLVVGMAVTAKEALKSGHQPGEELSDLFEPLNVTGPWAGEPHCLVCENGANPVAMIFARELTDPLLKLIARIDEAAAGHRDQQMGSFVVFLSEDEKLKGKLEAAAKKHSLKHTILAIDAPAGPDGFKIAQEADVTVVLYERHKVQANHALTKGELTDKAIEAVLADVPKILPAKKAK
ncbi:MAG TPA: hypothetical protein VMP01_13560 [Pirellulaceae bacterium]|nr:hypothetical protein [Pirellulaceae bacterium]